VGGGASVSSVGLVPGAVCLGHRLQVPVTGTNLARWEIAKLAAPGGQAGRCVGVSQSCLVGACERMALTLTQQLHRRRRVGRLHRLHRSRKDDRSTPAKSGSFRQPEIVGPSHGRKRMWHRAPRRVGSLFSTFSSPWTTGRYCPAWPMRESTVEDRERCIAVLTP
jgi:hypothetical protein